jgi:aminopeptidase
MDSRIIMQARTIINYSLYLKAGEKLLIEGNHVALPLIKAAYKEALLAGALPKVKIFDDELGEILYKYGTDEQIKYIPESNITDVKTYDAFFSIWANQNTRAMTNISPEKIGLKSKAAGEIMRIFMERAGKKELKWCGTQFPTVADAQEASMSLSEYEDFVFNACHLNSCDPFEEWNKIHDIQQKYVNFLDTKKQLRIVSKDTDIRMSIEGRKWMNSDGHENFPSGEVFTGPVENSINGHIRFSFPGIFQGKEIENIILTFEDGKVVKAEASKGQELLNEILKIEGAKNVGEVAMGTNYNIQKFTKNMLFDEKIGGTVHMALGAAYPQTGGENKSDIHWDMLCDMRNGGEIYADEELIYRDGKFKI